MMTRRQTLTAGIAAVAAAALPSSVQASPSTDGNPIRETRHEGHWRPWFAWKPVEVEAYRNSRNQGRQVSLHRLVSLGRAPLVVIDHDWRYDQDAWEGYQYRPTMPVGGE